MHSRSIGRRIIRVLVFLTGLAGIALSAQATTYYVRTDGGTATQCNGTANAPASSAPNCAWSNPQYAIPPGFPGDGAKAPRIAAGDTLQIASGSYQFGYGSPGAEACQSQYAYNCVLIGKSIPDNVTIQGDCSAPPELWGGGHQYNLFDLSGSSGVTLRCLTLTDHGTCIDGTFTGIPSCSNSATDTSVQDGIDIRGANNVTLDRVNIHGLADYGILAGQLTGTTTVTGVTIRANAWGGWNGDLGGNGTNSKNSGTITIRDSTIAWNGCTEAYPATTIVGCRGAEQGGYGDGLGTALTGGNWRIINSRFLYNTSDGLDLLYADGTGSVFVDRVTAIGNASQQVKVAAPATVQNSVIVGWCSATALSSAGLTTLCRAAGNAVELDFTATNQAITFAYNTVTGNGDCLISSGNGSAAPTGFNPDASDTIAIGNNIMLGQTSYLQRNGGGYTCAVYASVSQGVTRSGDIVWNTRNTDFSTPGIINEDPQLTDETMASFNPVPLVSSPAIGNSVSGSTPVAYDYNGNPRPSQGATIGAVEYQGSSSSTAGAPSADFAYSASGLAVNFTDTSTDTGGTIGSWAWSFGDGAASSAQNPGHSYAAAGTYQVGLSVTDKISGKTSTRSAQVTVTAPQQVGGTPSANFTYSTSGLTASFIDASTDNGGSIGSWAWSFGDGSASSAQNPGHAYAAAGTYQVVLTVTDKVSGKTSTHSAQVTVTAPQLAGGTPKAAFTYSVSRMTVNFTDKSTDDGGTIDAWSWSFGDGTTSSTRNPSHVYGSAGYYTVTETVRDQASGKTSSASRAVRIAKHRW